MVKGRNVQMKKIISIVFSLIMTFGVLIHPLEAQAANKELTADEVVTYFNSKVGNSVPEASCLAFIANGFEALGAERSSACCAYRYGTEHIVSTNKDNIPVGADVFLNWNSNYSYTRYVCPTCGNYCHHIGVYVGSGNVVHTSGGKVVITALDDLLNKWNMDFRGWGYHGNVTINGESGNTLPDSSTAAKEMKCIYFGHQLFKYGVPDSVEKELSSKEDGLYGVDKDYYRVIDGDVYFTIPVKWRVLEDNGDTLLLLQEHIYYGMNWDGDFSASNVVWEDADIKEYLNTTYRNTHFTESEKQDIVGVENNEIFLPSVDELEYYLPTAESRKAHYFADLVPNVTTPIVGWGEAYAYNRTEYTCAYWTRTASRYSYDWAQPSYVNCDGEIKSGGRMYYTWSAGVRPMMRIKKNSVNYYEAPKSVTFSQEEQKVVYSGEKFEIPVNMSGEGLVERYHPYISWSCDKGVNEENGSFNSFAGKRKITCRIYGVDLQTIKLETTVIARPAIEKIAVDGSNSSSSSMNISWTNPYGSDCYEIVRSTSKDGPYDSVYKGYLSSYGGEYCYEDSTAEENQQYWYKVRGLYGYSWNYYDTLEGYEAEFCEPVSGIIKGDSLPEKELSGWHTEEGKCYWYENGIKQGTEGRGKEIYDPDSDAWYWLDAVQGGAKAVCKDVYQESYSAYPDREDGTGKWVRYDENGHMVKGWQTTEAGTYYFETITGAMAKGNVTINGANYYFDPTTGIMQSGDTVQNGWLTIDGKDYWYENGVRQGYDPENPSYRGKEIYDPGTDAWYWLDNVQQGAKAVSKDVYQESYSAYPDREDGTGKWVRYDENGHMVKGWQTNEAGTYYFEIITGAMAKGNVTIDGVEYYFDPITGVKQ